MAITAAQIQFRGTNGVKLLDGRLNNLFGSTTTNGGTHYASLEVANINPDLTLSAVKAWIIPDVRGGAFAIAVDTASGAIALGDDWPDLDAAALTYTTPLTYEAGATVVNMPPGTKVRIVCRRVASGASAAMPENNRLYVGGTSPL